MGVKLCVDGDKFSIKMKQKEIDVNNAENTNNNAIIDNFNYEEFPFDNVENHHQGNANHNEIEERRNQKDTIEDDVNIKNSHKREEVKNLKEEENVLQDDNAKKQGNAINIQDGNESPEERKQREQQLRGEKQPKQEQEQEQEQDQGDVQEGEHETQNNKKGSIEEKKEEVMEIEPGASSQYNNNNHNNKDESKEEPTEQNNNDNNNNNNDIELKHDDEIDDKIEKITQRGNNNTTEQVLHTISRGRNNKKTFIPDIFSIIPKQDFESKDKTELLFVSNLQKMININFKLKIKYTDRFCMLTKENLIIYSTKDNYITLKRPWVILPISQITQIVLFKLYQKHVGYDHFYICFEKNKDTEWIIEQTNTFFLNKEDEMKEEGESKNMATEALLMFKSEDWDLIKKWYVIINYWKEISGMRQ